MKELKAQLRGDKEWTIIPSDDAEVELQAMIQIMRYHGFKVVTGEGGEKRVINPLTKECEVIYTVY